MYPFGSGIEMRRYGIKARTASKLLFGDIPGACLRLNTPKKRSGCSALEVRHTVCLTDFSSLMSNVLGDSTVRVCQLLVTVQSFNDLRSL